MTKRDTTMLPLKMMMNYEEWIEQKIEEGYNLRGNPQDLCHELKLNIERKNMSLPIAASLNPANKENFFGVIYINTMIDDNTMRYALLHEIVRYLLFVGIGNFVEKKNTPCLKRREPKTDDEKKIDYITRAIIMPWTSLYEELIIYHKLPRSVNRLRYIAKQGKKYGEEIKHVITSSYFKRMQEVTCLVRYTGFLEKMKYGPSSTETVKAQMNQ